MPEQKSMQLQMISNLTKTKWRSALIFRHSEYVACFCIEVSPREFIWIYSATCTVSKGYIVMDCHTLQCLCLSTRSMNLLPRSERQSKSRRTNQQASMASLQNNNNNNNQQRTSFAYLERA